MTHLLLQMIKRFRCFIERGFACLCANARRQAAWKNQDCCLQYAGNAIRPGQYGLHFLKPLHTLHENGYKKHFGA